MTEWERFWDAALDVAGKMAAKSRIFSDGVPESRLDPVQRLTLEAEGEDADGFDESWNVMMSYGASAKKTEAGEEEKEERAKCGETEKKET